MLGACIVSVWLIVHEIYTRTFHAPMCSVSAPATVPLFHRRKEAGVTGRCGQPLFYEKVVILRNDDCLNSGLSGTPDASP